MYTKAAALNSDTHRALRWQPRQGYAFAAGIHSAPLSANEFFTAARDLAIIFARPDEKAEPTPLAVLGLTAGQNLYVDGAGAWSGRFVPMSVASYPFAVLGRPDENGAFGVVIDEDYAGFSSADGERLFNDDGSQTTFLQERLRLLNDYQVEVERTRRLCAELARLDLLISRSVQVTGPDGKSHQLDGCWMVEEARIGRLSDADLLGLARSGALALITAHLMSLANLDGLPARKGSAAPAAGADAGAADGHADGAAAAAAAAQ
jgi:hypothetical protein